MNERRGSLPPYLRDADLLDDLTSRQTELLRDLEQLVRQESPTADLAAVAASARLVARIGERLFDRPPELVTTQGVTHVRWRFGSGPCRVLLLGHHDTVWPVGSLARNPWACTGGVVRGPGCFDMKTGIVQALYAVAAVVSRDGGMGAADGVTLLITGDEETGSRTSRKLIEAEAAHCTAALVLEASGPEGALKTERKGVSDYELKVRGRAAHAGLEPERGVNATVELAHQILAVNALGNPGLGTTTTPTVSSAGTTVNTVPAAASLHVDVRCRSDAEQQRIDASIRALHPVLPGSMIEIEGGINRPPLQPNQSAELFSRARALAPRASIAGLHAIAVGGASDGNLTAGIGVPTLDGLGAVGGGAHADDEHVVIEAIPSRTALLTLLVEDLLTTTRSTAHSARHA